MKKAAALICGLLAILLAAACQSPAAETADPEWNQALRRRSLWKRIQQKIRKSFWKRIRMCLPGFQKNCP